ncbi:DUF1642 domain-containing protein [Streptococcus cristatus]|uniref:DUF1642 domain-containing protein n=1 Tax=Streptococcus cristatus TaxID=45634 RepID=UPI0039C1878C
MKKQELIKRIEQLFAFGSRDYIERNEVLNLVKQLDEPKKVTIPQFVVDWIEVCKENLAIGLYTAMNPDFLEQWNKSDELICWIRKTSNQELFALAWIFGYEVEKEKRYRISMPKARNYKNHAQFLCEKDSKMFWCAEWYSRRTKFTRKELEEANFGWVFDCPGIEIEEVEE